jgi:hypothetical protein
VLLLPVAACGGDDSDETSRPTDRGAGDLEAFCVAMGDLSSGAVTDPAAVTGWVETIEETAPPDIKADATEFARLSKVVTDAFTAAGAPDEPVDSQAVVAGLPADAQTFVSDLAATAESGRPGDTIAGRVGAFVATNCDTDSAPSSLDTPRLECHGEVFTFEVTGAPIGQALPTYASADEAAQAEVDERDDVTSYALVGDDPAGTRYALLRNDHSVVAEAVFAETDGGWQGVQYDDCEGPGG